MAKLLRLRRGTTAQHGSFTGAEGEVTVDTTKDTLVVHDNATAGGRPMLREDLNNMPNSGVTAGTYGSSSAIPSITVDAKGRITSATTSAIDSTAITNGTSNVSVAASGDITATRAGTTRLTVNSGGIDVTGTVTCDGMTCEGTALINSGSGILQLRDNDGAGTGDSVNYVEGQRSNGSINWRVGDVDSTSDLYLTAAADSNIIFSTNGTNRAVVNNEGIKPWANNTYDLGTSSAQWRNAYFDGTVNCDGLVCEGNATISASNGILELKDSDSTGNACVNFVRGMDSAGTHKWLIGDVNADGDLYVGNLQAGAMYLQTNSTSRAFLSNDGHFLPVNTNTYDLGGTSNRWRNVYTNDLNLSNEGGANDVDGTWGSWTIQEGEDELFLLNRRNGKKYKFALQEVN